MGWADGKVALVSGAGRGIGREIALGLARGGARVVINDRDNDPLEETAAAVRSAGGACAPLAADVTAADFGERMVAAACDAFGGVDIIVNNAGYTWDGVIHKMTDAQFDAMLAVHLTAPFRLLRAALGPLREAAAAEARRGEEVLRKVVNISSVAGTRGNVGQVNYAAAKAGLIGLTRTLAKEWGRYKINVNAVAFGLIETRLTGVSEAAAPLAGDEASGATAVRVGIPAATRARMLESIALGRAGTPAEAAGAVLMLCGPGSDYVTGQVIEAAGGLAF